MLYDLIFPEFKPMTTDDVINHLAKELLKYVSSVSITLSKKDNSFVYECSFNNEKVSGDEVQIKEFLIKRINDFEKEALAKKYDNKVVTINGVKYRLIKE